MESFRGELRYGGQRYADATVQSSIEFTVAPQASAGVRLTAHALAARSVAECCLIQIWAALQADAPLIHTDSCVSRAMRSTAALIPMAGLVL